MFARNKNSHRDGNGLQNLTIVEARLRHGQLNDSLLQTKAMIRQRTVMLGWSKAGKGHTLNKATSTRFRTRLDRATALIKATQKTYNRARNALLILGEQVDTPRMLDSDLNSNDLMGYLKLGKGGNKLSWLWKMKKDIASSGADAVLWNMKSMCIFVWYVNRSQVFSVARLEWFESRANAERFKEEKEILEEELKRCKRTFSFFANLWSHLIIPNPTTEQENGRNAYVLKTVANYILLRDGVIVPDSADTIK